MPSRGGDSSQGPEEVGFAGPGGEEELPRVWTEVGLGGHGGGLVLLVLQHSGLCGAKGVLRGASTNSAWSLLWTWA